MQRLLDRPRHLRTCHRMAGESERLEFTELSARLDQPHQCRSEIGQIGPRMNHVERPRIRQAALLHMTDDHAIEPTAGAFVAAAVEITCAQNDATDAQIPQLILERDPQRTLARDRVHRGRFVEYRRHVRAVVVDVAGQHERCSGGACGGDRSFCQLRDQGRPLGVGRIERVQDDVHALRGFGDGLQCRARRPRPPVCRRQLDRPKCRAREKTPANRRREMPQLPCGRCGRQRRVSGCVWMHSSWRAL